MTNNVVGICLSVIEDKVLSEVEIKLSNLEIKFNFVFFFIIPCAILARTSKWKACDFSNY